MLLVDLNDNPLGLSPAARHAVVRAAEFAHAYPREGVSRFVRQLATYHRLGDAQVLPGAGSSDVLRLVLDGLGDSGRALIFSPPLPGYLEVFARRRGMTLVKVAPDQRLGASLAAMTEAIAHAAEMPLVLLSCPDGFTGRCYPRDELADWIMGLEGRARVIVDESGIEFYANPEGLSMAALLRAGAKHLVVLRSFSRAYGLAGLRVGYGLGDAALLQHCRAGMLPYPLSQPALCAASDALDNQEWLEQSLVFLDVLRHYLVEGLQAMGIEVLEGHGGFVVHALPGDATAFQAVLTAASLGGVESVPGLDDWCRVSAGTVEDAARYLEVVARFRARTGQ